MNKSYSLHCDQYLCLTRHVWQTTWLVKLQRNLLHCNAKRTDYYFTFSYQWCHQPRNTGLHQKKRVNPSHEPRPVWRPSQTHIQRKKKNTHISPTHAHIHTDTILACSCNPLTNSCSIFLFPAVKVIIKSIYKPVGSGINYACAC